MPVFLSGVSTVSARVGVPSVHIVHTWLRALRGRNGKWTYCSEVELFRSSAVTPVTRGSHAGPFDDTGRVVSACLACCARAGGSLPKVIAMLRLMDGDRATQVNQWLSSSSSHTATRRPAF